MDKLSETHLAASLSLISCGIKNVVVIIFFKIGGALLSWCQVSETVFMNFFSAKLINFVNGS